MQHPDFISEAALLGIDPDRLFEQWILVKRLLESNKDQGAFKIIDTCRPDNQRLLGADWVRDQFDETILRSYASFVPAAGASSRYLAPLFPLIETLERGKPEDVKQAWSTWERMRWVLPRGIGKFDIDALASPKEFNEMALVLQKPKAFFPCDPSGRSFLEMKCIENAALGSLAGEVYVAPAGFTVEMQNHIETVAPSANAICFEQGAALSTLRFKLDGCPARDSDGALSMVSAGHGALIELLPKVRERFPAAHSIFIRNIDNVIGTSKEHVVASQRFLAAHHTILSKVQTIRAALETNRSNAAADAARDLLKANSLRTLDRDEQATLDRITNMSQKTLWHLQFSLFQTPLALFGTTLKALQRVYARPVNLMGQVPNLGKDVGGSPVVAQSKHGPLAICLEGPHVSARDRAEFSMDPKKTTHFNPVFVAAEIPRSLSGYHEVAQDFCLLARKQWRGEEVCFYETILYEILGNSYSANCAFIEIPRILFNPHKSLDDLRGPV